jgi:signal transduction histidine kinase
MRTPTTPATASMARPTAGAATVGRSVAYLVTGLPLGLLGFLWSVASSLLTVLIAATHLGGPAFLGATWVTRRLAGLERRRAGWVLGGAIPARYQPSAGEPMRRRVTIVLGDSATWRDLAWLVLLLPLGAVGGIAAAVITAVELGAITAPLWASTVPNPHAPGPMGFLMTTGAGRVVLTLIGLGLVPVAAVIVRFLADGLVRLAGVLLGPGSETRLLERAEQLAGSRRRVVDAQAAELRRIERDLHDGAQARIVAAGMTLALASRKLRAGPEGSAAAGSDVDLARHQLDEALAELRHLVRGIHPPILTDRGLYAALAALSGDAPFDVELRGDRDARYPAAVEAAAYFVVAEGLANATKHAEATAASIELTRTGDELRVAVTDNGRGGADPDGSGVDGLRRRIEALDGALTLTSPPGGPTTLYAELPCAS